MDEFMRRIVSFLLVLFCGLLFGLFSPIPLTQPTHAQTKPFIFPVAAPPGPASWLFGQPYGNTIGAFVRGADWYDAGQRLHFGIDVSMPCDTPLVAIGDGEVIFVDDLGFGSGPHNLLIRHAAEGVISLYGHLLDRPLVVPGQFVTAGQEVARSGDPDVTCDSRPHLHLEIRSLDYFTAYNPVDYIAADWHTLLLIGSFRYPNFQQDLDNARRWMSVDDQPAVVFGGRALNNYAAPFPDSRADAAPTNPHISRTLDVLPESAEFAARRLAFDGCCPGAWWHPTQPNTLYLIDGAEGQRASIFEWNTSASELSNLIGQAPPPTLSPDGTHEIRLISDTDVLIRRFVDDIEWTVNTEGEMPALSTDNARLLWVQQGQVPLPGQNALTTFIWVGDADGANTRMIATESGLNAQWLDEARILITRRMGISTTLGVYDTRDDSVFILGIYTWMRQLTVAPGGGRIMFFVVNQEDPAQGGVYTIETQPNAQAQHLDWFGSWRWRDANSVYYVPFDGAAYNTPSLRHSLRFYNITTGDDQLLADNFAIANGDWSVSASGAQIAFWSADDMTVWLLEQILP
jgi:hypothetical protein